MRVILVAKMTDGLMTELKCSVKRGVPKIRKKLL